jgi:caa(3)-type oxidase subunit IV
MDHSTHTARSDDLHTPDPAVVREVKSSIKKYIIVGLVLFGGTVLTVLVAPIDFGYHWRNIAIGLVIATIKASCVALIFMHLSHERGMIYKVLLFTVIFFAAMLFLFILGLKDPIHFDFYKQLTGSS